MPHHKGHTRHDSSLPRLIPLYSSSEGPLTNCKKRFRFHSLSSSKKGLLTKTSRVFIASQIFYTTLYIQFWTITIRLTHQGIDAIYLLSSLHNTTHHHYQQGTPQRTFAIHYFQKRRHQLTTPRICNHSSTVTIIRTSAMDLAPRKKQKEIINLHPSLWDGLHYYRKL